MMYRPTAAADNGSAGSSMSSDMSSMGSDMSSMSSDMSSMSSDMSSDTTVVISQATTTTAAWNSYQTPTYQPPTYGSGSSNWGSSSNYNDCVSRKCASHRNKSQDIDGTAQNALLNTAALLNLGLLLQPRPVPIIATSETVLLTQSSSHHPRAFSAMFPSL